MFQAREALAVAHSFGSVHRDPKPANLVVARGADRMRTAEVLDFSISNRSAVSLRARWLWSGPPR